MAKCVAHGSPFVPPLADKYTLELSAIEAQTLQLILRKVGGSPDKSLRKHAAEMLAAINSSGLSYHALSSAYAQDHCGIYFKDIK